LNSAGEDFADKQFIDTKIAEIENIRQDKIKQGLQKGIEEAAGSVPGFMLNNLSSMEINRMREFVCSTMYELKKISGEMDEVEEEGAADEDAQEDDSVDSEEDA
jgi:hypothetical protein